MAEYGLDKGAEVVYTLLYYYRWYGLEGMTRSAISPQDAKMME